MNKDLLIIFTKNPVAGKVKTRLAEDLGNNQALEVYKFLLEHSVEVTKPVKADKQVHYSDKIPEIDIWSSQLFIKRQQQGKDLGERMENAFKAGFDEGYERIIIIGTDLYDIKTSDLELAFSELEKNDFVIGPAEDGGYYLLGMKSLNSELFRNKKWSTSSVFDDSLKNMNGQKVKILETQNDIDVLDDIKDHPAFQKFINI
ncbi:TIGR04282 family arsenosugar biosynthesis glycosyltransferase [Gramella lutea]|uniref:TIGR04282 family arsenosugar biosynthesis glycosyltransferase n=1 Tax=Christiangramia lutea TaxID=1607951 RepID=A0A9X1V0V8_9FLAO|nr:TIGR04282 family arsenosugar biosynthesis glycosyltransferase [Christiangramia lutea]